MYASFLLDLVANVSSAIHASRVLHNMTYIYLSRHECDGSPNDIIREYYEILKTSMSSVAETSLSFVSKP